MSEQIRTAAQIADDIIEGLREFVNHLEACGIEPQAEQQEGAGWRYFVRTATGYLNRANATTDELWHDDSRIWMHDGSEWNLDRHVRCPGSTELTEREAVERFGPEILDDKPDTPSDLHARTESNPPPESWYAERKDPFTPDTPTADTPKTLADAEAFMLCEGWVYLWWRDDRDNVYSCNHDGSDPRYHPGPRPRTRRISRVLGPVHVTAKEQSDE